MNSIYKKFLLALILSLILCGCAGNNMRQGDLDFPRINPEPKHVLKIHGTIDSKLHVKFASYWIVTNGKAWPVSDANCNNIPNYYEGISNQYFVLIPVEPKINKDHYEFEIATDGFLPGRCGWIFSGLLAYTDKQVFDNLFSVEAAELIVAYNSYLSWWPRQYALESIGNHVEVSCKADTYSDFQSAHGSGPFLNCVDTKSGNRIRYLLHEGNTTSLELHIHSDGKPK
jgi:hypothetical protein